MIPAFDGSSADGPGDLDAVGPSRRAPGRLDDPVPSWSTYGLALFAVLAAVGRWPARRVAPAATAGALAVPVAVVAADGVDSALPLTASARGRSETAARWIASGRPRPLLVAP
ncbi:hypothetical protein AB0N17_01960 [Streptomyces sp. NPDC051133]|uniref:hypothetical protein n=1 Tax=Streptomyces sp. NPDC051133 TaxID=3155521 RepID=UPI00342FDFC1